MVDHNPGLLVLAPRVRCFVEDVPALLERHVNKVGLLCAVSTPSPDDVFPSAAIYESIDGGVTWNGLQNFYGQAVAGSVVGTMTGDVSARVWDTVTELTVILDKVEDELSSEPDEAVLQGRMNWMLVGSEIIGFAEATLIADRTYTLTRLLRGRRNTEQWIGNHAADERVLLLTGPSSVTFVEMGHAAYRSVRQYKAVPSGYSPTDIDEHVEVLIDSESIKPFSPILLPIVIGSNGDITVRWVRRSRSIFRLLSGLGSPPNDCCEKNFSLDIWDAGRTEVLRTVEVVESTEFVYTAAMQTTDFGAPQTSLALDAYQVSETVGRGRVARSEDTMAEDPVIGSTLLAEGQAGAEPQHNEMIARFMAAIIKVKTFQQDTPPGAPVNFESWIIGATPTGAWAGQANKIAVYLDGWKFMAPTEGMRVRVTVTDITVDYDGTNWSSVEGEQTLVDGASIPWNMALGRAAVVTLGGNRAVASPTNVVNGRLYTLFVVQDATGTRTLTWGALFKWPGGVAPTLSVAANAVDRVNFIARAGNLYGQIAGLAYA